MVKYSKIEAWDGSHMIIFYNPAEVEREGETAVEYMDNVIVPEASKGAIVEALVRKEFSVSDELAILRQRTSKKAEFNAYDARVEELKAIADQILAGLE